MALKKAAFLDPKLREVGEYEIEGFPERVRLKRIPVGDAQMIQKKMNESTKNDDNSILLEVCTLAFGLSAVNDDDTQMFTHEEAEGLLRQLPSDLALRLGLCAMRHSKIISQETNVTTDEEVEKNSQPAQSTDLVSA